MCFGAVGYHPLVECVHVFSNTEEVGDKYQLWSWAYPAFMNISGSPNLSSHLYPDLHTKGCLRDSSFGESFSLMALGFPTSWPAEGVVSVVWPATSHFP